MRDHAPRYYPVQPCERPLSPLVAWHQGGASPPEGKDDVFFSKLPEKTQKTKTSRRTRECFMQPQIAAAPAPVSALHKGWSSALKKAKVVAHYGFVPLVLYLGFQSEGQPGFLQLFLPFA
jgi:hypothetical protein